MANLATGSMPDLRTPFEGAMYLQGWATVAAIEVSLLFSVVLVLGLTPR